MRNRKLLAIVIAVVATTSVTGCERIGKADLFDVAPPAMPTSTETDPVDKAIDQAIQLRNDYTEIIRWKIASIPYYTVPLLGAAATAIGGLLFGSHPDLIAGAGLAGGSVLGLQLAFDPAKVATVYVDSVGALDCIIANAAPLMKAVRTIDLEKSEKERIAVNSAVTDAQSKLGDLLAEQKKPGFPPELLPPAEKAKKDADAALKAAKDALTAFAAEEQAILSAKIEVGLQVSTVHSKTIKKLIDVHNVSFSDLQSAISGAVTSLSQQKAIIDAALQKFHESDPADDQPTPSGAAIPQAVLDGIKLIDALNVATKTLKSSVDRLLKAMPKFKVALTQTKTCTAAL